MDRKHRVRTTPGTAGESSLRNLRVAVERRHIPPRPWLWTILDGERRLAVAERGFAGAEEAWEAAQREVTRRMEVRAQRSVLRLRGA